MTYSIPETEPGWEQGNVDEGAPVAIPHSETAREEDGTCTHLLQSASVPSREGLGPDSADGFRFPTDGARFKGTDPSSLSWNRQSSRLTLLFLHKIKK